MDTVTENWTVSSPIGGDRDNWGFSLVSEEAEVRWQVGIILTLLIVLIALGNSLVIFAVLLEKQLRTFENFFFASLAVADLSIALFVLPLSLIVEMSDGKWHFGRMACDFFIFVDVSCCTASILHLCAIGLNRYCSISSPMKTNFKQNNRRALLMILSVWSLSFVVASPPLFGWPERTDSISDQCTYDEDKLYIVVSALSSFYIPLVVMCVVYYQIYQLSKKGARYGHKDEEDKNQSPQLINSADYANHNTSDQFQSSSRLNSGSISQGFPRIDVMSKSSCETRASPRDDPLSQAGRKCHKLWSLVRLATAKRRKKKTKKNKSKAKTAKTLGLIMTVFVVCWLPFFLLYVIKPFCPHCYIPVALDRSALWLGYANSLLNPIIYICCKPSFRRAFQKILRMDYCSRYRFRIDCFPPRYRIMTSHGRCHIVQQDFSSTSRAEFDQTGGLQNRCCCIQRKSRHIPAGRCVWMASSMSVTSGRSSSSPPSNDDKSFESGNKRVTYAFVNDIPKRVKACNGEYQQPTCRSVQITPTVAIWNENVDPPDNRVDFDHDSRAHHRAPGKETNLILNSDNSPRIRVLKRRSTWSEPLNWRPRDCSPNRSVCEEADATQPVTIHLPDDNNGEVVCQTPKTLVSACLCTFDGIKTPSWPSDEMLSPQRDQHSRKKETGYESDHENQSLGLNEQNETIL